MGDIADYLYEQIVDEMCDDEADFPLDLPLSYYTNRTRETTGRYAREPKNNDQLKPKQTMSNQDELAQGPEAGSGASGRFLHIAGGKIIERTTADNPKAIKRTPKPNDDGTPRPDVYELQYKSFSGIIEGMHNRERTTNFGGVQELRKSTVVRMRAGDELYNLELEHNSRYWPIFVNCLASGKVDFSRGVRIGAWDYERKVDGKRIIGLALYQMATEAQKAPNSGVEIEEDGTVKVPWRWTKDNPGKLPAAVQIPIPGKKPVWSFEERDNFLRAVVEHYGAELKAKHQRAMSAAEQVAAPVAAPTQQPTQKMAQPDLKLQQQQTRHAPPLTEEENSLLALDQYEAAAPPADDEVNPW
jgi:hypothetical protein